MLIVIGLWFIAVGAFCQAGCYIPSKRVTDWSWETFWLVQGLFAWLLFPFVGALAAIPEGKTVGDLFALIADHLDDAFLCILFGALWGIGGLTFGLSMRFLGVALGQSISLGACAALGVIITPLFTGHADLLTTPVIVGVVVTVVGIAIIGMAGHWKSRTLSKEEQQATVKQFNFGKGVALALLCGFMSACFAIGLGYGEHIAFAESDPMFRALPATLMVTVGGFVTNLGFSLMQHVENKTLGDYLKGRAWLNNLPICMMSGFLWYCQFFGLSIGKGFLQDSPALLTFSWGILMAFNIIFSNVWGLLLNEWRGCSRGNIALLLLGIATLLLSTFLPQLL